MSRVAKIHIHSDLSQGYLPVAQQNAFGKKAFTMLGSQVFASALDENGKLWVSCPQNGSHTGSVLQKTNYVSATTEFLRTVDGEILHFTSVQDEAYVQRSLEKAGGGVAAYQSMQVEPPIPGAVIRRILPAEYNQDGDSQILLAFFFETGAGVYQVTLAYWDRESSPAYVSTTLHSRSLHGYWHFGQREEEPYIEFCILDESCQKVQVLDLSTQSISALDLGAPVQDIDWYSRDGQRFGIVQKNRRLYHMTENGDSIELHSLFEGEGESRQACPFDQIRLQDDGQILHLWGLSGDTLYHFSNLSPAGNRPDEFLILDTGVESFHVCAGSEGAGHVMAVYRPASGDSTGTAAGLTVYQVPLSGSVTRQRVEVDSAQECMEINCYTTQITLQDADGAPAVNCRVELKPMQPSILYVGDRRYSLSPTESAWLQPNRQGKLVIRQPQEDLAAVDLCFRMEGEDKYYEIKPDNQVIAHIRNVTAEELTTRSLDDETMLLDPSRPETERRQIAENVENLVGRMLSQVSTPNLLYDCVPDSRLDDTSRRFARCCGPAPSRQVQEPQSVDMGRFHVVFSDGGGISVKAITSNQQMAQLRAQVFARVGCSTIPEADKNGFFSKLREFLRSVAKGFVALTEMIVDTAKTVFTYIINGVERIVEFVVKTVKEVAHCVCEVFHRIAIGFNRLIQWLGILFNWGDIKRTKHALEKWLDKTLEQGQQWMTSPQRMQDIDRIRDSFLKELDGLLDGLRRDMDASKAGQAAKQDQKQEQLRDHAGAHDLVGQKLLEPGALQHPTPLLSQNVSGVLENLIQELEQIPLPKDAWEAFQKDAGRLLSAKGSLNDLLDVVIDLLKLLIHMTIGFAAALIKTLWASAAKLLELLLGLMNQPLYIPGVSSLLKLCGIELPSIKDILLYMIAIPATVTYKLIYNTAPIPQADTLSISISSHFLDLAQFLSCSAYFVFNDLVCLEDLVSNDSQNAATSTISDLISVLAVTCCTMWVMLDYGSDIEAKEMETTTWICLGCDATNILYDILSIIHHQENRYLRLMVEFALATVYSACAIIETTHGHMDVAESVAYILPGIHDIVLSLRFTDGKVGTSSMVCSALVAAVDLIFEGISDLS